MSRVSVVWSIKFTVRLLFKVVVPAPSPMAMVVASPPMFRVVVVVFKRLKVVAVEVRSPPFMAKSFVAVTLPVSVEVLSIVRVPAA